MSSTSAEMFTTRDCRCVSLRRAVQADQEAIATLLRDLQLPTDGVSEWLDRFWVAEHQSQVVGVAGMERYGDSGLLRSVAVAQAWRGTGVARTLVDRVLEEGRTYWVKLDGVSIRLKMLQKPHSELELWRCEAPRPFNYEIQVPAAAFVEACAPQAI